MPSTAVSDTAHYNIMRFLIVTYDEYINIPYIEKYERSILAQGGSYDVILWDRRNCIQDVKPNWFVFKGRTGKGKLTKALPFLRWRHFVCHCLRADCYDRLIVLTTIPAILLYDQLMGKYKRKFLFDIRDYTYEGIPIYKWMVNCLVKASCFTAISSKAFFSFIEPAENIGVTHNISNLPHAVSTCTLRTGAGRSIVIGFVGGIRYYKENTRLLAELKNNPRYFFKYVGKTHPGCELEKFCRIQGIRNVSFSPAYMNGEKPEIYRAIDLINAVYGADSPETRLALPNKLYDCIIFKKPILVSRGTYLAQIVEEYGLGLSIELKEGELAEQIEAYLYRFDQARFMQGCKALLQRVCQEEDALMQRLWPFCGYTEK